MNGAASGAGSPRAGRESSRGGARAPFDQERWKIFATPEARERLIAVSRRYGAKGRSEAEDCVQEAMVAAYTTRAPLEDEERALAWLSRIVANTTLMHIRAQERLRRGGHFRHVKIDDAEVPAACNPERRLLQRETLHQLRTMRIVDRERELLHAYFYWDGPLAALAEARGENLNAMKTRLRRLRARMRAFIGGPEAAG